MASPVSSESSKVLEPLVMGLNQLASEIKSGAWKNREDELFSKIGDIMQRNQSFLSEHPLDEQTNAKFTASLQSLKEALGSVANKTEKIRQTITILSNFDPKDKISAAKLPQALASGSLNASLISRLPYETDQDIKTSLQTFRNLLKDKNPEASTALAKWISTGQIPLEKLRLTFDEIDAISPHITYLDLNGYNASEDLLADMLKNCSKLETLRVTCNDQLRDLPPLPRNVKDCSVTNCENLETVSQLNDGLKTFDCSSNERLKFFKQPSLPQSLEEFICSGCTNLPRFPKLNDGLKKLICSECPNLNLPNVLNPGLKDFDCRKCTIQLLPVLPDGLETLDCRECHNMKHIRSLSDSLREVDIRENSDLESLPEKLPKDLKVLYVSWCPKLKMPSQLPAGLKVVK